MDDDLQKKAAEHLAALREKGFRSDIDYDGYNLLHTYYETHKHTDWRELAAAKLEEAEACVRDKKDCAGAYITLNVLADLVGGFEPLGIDGNRAEAANRASGTYNLLRIVKYGDRSLIKRGFRFLLFQINRAGGVKAAGITAEQIRPFLTYERTKESAEAVTTVLSYIGLSVDFEPVEKTRPTKPGPPSAPPGAPQAG